MACSMNFTPIEIAFWILFFLLVHCYLIFPVTLPFLSELFCRKNRKAKEEKTLPKVSILVSAYNEEAVIEKKILNFLEIDYPKELLEILIGDDGSADRTAEIVERYADKGICLVKAPQNAGNDSSDYIGRVILGVLRREYDAFPERDPKARDTV